MEYKSLNMLTNNNVYGRINGYLHIIHIFYFLSHFLFAILLTLSTVTEHISAIPLLTSSRSLFLSVFLTSRFLYPNTVAN